jgi:hypothetical protein
MAPRRERGRDVAGKPVVVMAISKALQRNPRREECKSPETVL